MTSFKDADGKEYTIRLNVRLWQFVKEKTGVDLAGDFQKSMLVLHNDLAAFCNVLYHIVKGSNQFDGDEAAFFDVLNGEALEAAREAVVHAVIDFFPNRNQRDTATEVVKKANVLQDSLARRAKVVIDEKATSLTERISRSTSSDTLGKLLDELGETRGNTPSAN